MPKARVIFDAHGYRDANGDTRYGNRDDVIEVSQAELDRGLEIGSLEKVSGKAPTSEPDPTEPKALTKKQLVEAGKALDPPLDLDVKAKLEDLQAAVQAAGGSITEPSELTTPAGDPVGDGQKDVDA